MKNYRKELTFETETRLSFMNITEQIEEAIRESGIMEGLALITPTHVTASCFISDNEKSLIADFTKWCEKMAPHEPLTLWKHNAEGEQNADAYLKRLLMGRECVVAITGGKGDFGTWEQIFYADFDGKRAKNVLIKIIGE